ncbi:MAG: succinate dehydrogenase cytochrome b subunit [Bacteroidetes bacterium]|jgi:succinate dehydrogenase / fumarate reductase, cytochrome b subunit|nr:succinate dehydrogenase cytochrome b subunit [Bacteroidota bacterium]MBT3750378.1 succinate dehydrogenase cytochrome b subunit [Bacteroidota bacterium]MBT4409701.1 succinate dehydrogenase cytochrome b subunit [Bacteroidota bacterium]MBT7091914.1 succinate dehydrogenase cytochrome b subunit [Bacteroidota bacterium]MBT7462490.1 succinate dehydrogenase cytochrome b subunit [Bacteroidota bacterium]
MSSFLNSSIGKKFLMSLSGLFLLSFLLVHLILNSFILFDNTGELFNQAAHFMAANPIIKVVEPVLAIGFILHILYAIILTLHNLTTRPVGYNKQKQAHASSWSSRNMFVLGLVVLTFLVIHVANFFWKIKFTGHELLEHGMVGEVENTYLLVTTFFIDWWWIVAVYVIGSVALGLHLYHSIWAAFQTLGLSNQLWRRRLNRFGLLVSILIAGGFAVIPLWVKISSLL